MILYGNKRTREQPVSSNNFFPLNTYGHPQIIVRTKVDHAFFRSFNIDWSLLWRYNDAFVLIGASIMDIVQLLLQNSAEIACGCWWLSTSKRQSAADQATKFRVHYDKQMKEIYHKSATKFGNQCVPDESDVGRLDCRGKLSSKNCNVKLFNIFICGWFAER